MKKILMLFCLLFAFSAHAKEIDMEQILQNVQNNYTKLKSFEAKISQELFHRESNTTEKRQGQVLFGKPENILLETTSPNPEFIIVNSKEIWNYLPDEEVAYRYPVSALQNSQIALSLLTGQTNIKDSFEVETLPFEDDSDLMGFVLYPHEPSTHLVEAQIWINPKTYLIEKLSVLDFFGNTNVITFEKFTSNVKIKKSDFEFKPPKGIDVEDRYND